MKYFCIEKNCNKIVSGKNRRCNICAQNKRFKNIEEREKLKGKIPWNKIEIEKRICMCGCNETFECKINSKQRFINHHHAKKENNGMYGKKQSELCKEINKKNRLGKKLSEETKEKIRTNTSLAKGGTGIPYENALYPKEFRLIREEIRERDNYQCQNCGMTEEEHIIVYGKTVEVHHIDYDKQNNRRENLITLCHPCNIRANFNRSYWQEYYKKKVTNNV